MSESLNPIKCMSELRNKGAVVPISTSSHENQLIEQILQQEWEYIDDERLHKKNAASKLFDNDVDEFPVDEVERTWNSIFYRIAGGEVITRTNPDTAYTLTTEQEVSLFLQYNFARMKVYNIQQRSLKRRLSAKEKRQAISWSKVAGRTERILTVANLGLIQKMSGYKKDVRQSRWDEDCYAGARMALLRSIRKFNVSKGWKFSTYACRAILNSFERELGKSIKQAIRFHARPMDDDDYKHPSIIVDDGLEKKESLLTLRDVLDNNKALLTDREKQVIEWRFLIRDPYTLEECGKMLKVSKERVRQIQTDALDLLKNILTDGDEKAVSLN